MYYTFNDFLMLEKVTSREIKTILNDPNILVGIEFEMVLDDLGDAYGGGYDGYSSEEMDEMMHEYVNEIREYVDEIKAYSEEYKDVYLEDIKVNATSDLEDEIEELDKKYKKIESLLDDWATTNRDELEEELYNIEYEIKDAQGKIDNLNELDTFDLYEYIRDNIDDSVEDQFEYINNNIGYPPEMSGTLYEFYYNYVGESIEIDWAEVFTDPDYYNASYILSEYVNVPYPSEFLDDYASETGTDHLEDYPYWDDLPFSNFDIGEYHAGSAHSPDWRIETDSSLPTGGVEIISPAMPLQEMLKILPKMFKFIKDHGKTTKATGMHVNMSYKGKDFGKDADMLKLMLFVDEGHVWKNFPERVGNTYTSSVLKKIIENIKQNKETISSDFEKVQTKTLDTFRKNIKGPDQKFFGVNVSNAKGTNGRIEFRYLGGSDYHRKLKEITAAIGRFGFYMSIALDDKLKKKEYILKLNRLYQKHARNDVEEIHDPELLSMVVTNGKVLKKKKKGDTTVSIIYYKRKKWKVVEKSSSTNFSIKLFEA